MTCNRLRAALGVFFSSLFLLAQAYAADLPLNNVARPAAALLNGTSASLASVALPSPEVAPAALALPVTAALPASLSMAEQQPAPHAPEFAQRLGDASEDMAKQAALGAVQAAKTVEGWQQKGLASWYGPGFHGRKTASGERFNTQELTAAHLSLPFGTKLLVRNERNGKEVVVRVNDRGPYIKTRIIDLSQAAAKALGIDGVGRVIIQRLEGNGQEGKRLRRAD